MKKNLSINDFYGANVWSYTRVSTKEQFINNGSIENQVNKIKSFAQEYGLFITEEFDAEYESSKKINTQVTLKELTDKLKKTPSHKRPKIILIWSPSRFGRAGAEHIGLFVNLRKAYGVFLYSISTEHNTFNERAENEFSSQLLYAQKENFNRQDTIIPGMINSLHNGKIFGQTPVGYDHYGPKVKDPTKLRAVQEIKINATGELLREAFHLKLYKSMNDTQIREWLKLNGVIIARETMSRIWRTPFYAGRIKNSLLDGEIIKAPWEPIISEYEFDQLQKLLDKNVLVGIPKISGHVKTPLAPKFIICNTCELNMTAYFNKNRNLYYYKCNCCNKTINAISTPNSKFTGANEQFRDLLEHFKISDDLGKLIVAQAKKILSDNISNNADKKRILTTSINKLRSDLDTMEYRYAINELPKDIFERQSIKIKIEIEEKLKAQNNEPKKIANSDIVLKMFNKLAENPCGFYDSLDYHKKRRFQSIVFPKGIKYSIENREYRTSETNAIFDLTKSITESYNYKRNGTKSKKLICPI